MSSYLENPAIVKALESAPEYRKKELTALRTTKPHEVGVKFQTWAKSDTDPRGFFEEVSKDEINATDVIARNPGVIGYLDGEPLYNEWPIDRKTAEKNYGTEVIDGLTEEPTSHQKKVLIKAVRLDRALLDALGVKGDQLKFTVSWSSEEMTANEGDYLTGAGYSITRHDMENTYEQASPVISPNRLSKGEMKGKVVGMKSTQSEGAKMTSKIH